MRKVALFVIFISLTQVFSMSKPPPYDPLLDDVKTIRELEGYAVRNVWPDEKKRITPRRYNEMKHDYFNKAEMLGLDVWRTILYWKYRVDIHKLNELMDLKAVPKFLRNTKMTDQERSLLSQVTAVGRVDSVFSYTRNDAYFKTSYKIFVNEVVIGNSFISDSTYITVKKIEDSNFPVLEKDSTYFMFLSRFHIDSIAANNSKYEGSGFIDQIREFYKPLSNDINNKNVFTFEYPPYNMGSFMKERGTFRDYFLGALKYDMKHIEEINRSDRFLFRHYYK